MKHEYHEGKEALERFEQTATKLFQAPKVVLKKATPKQAGKGKKEAYTPFINSEMVISKLWAKTSMVRTQACLRPFSSWLM